jgi:ketosteroid isomerase-like protein
LEAFRVDSSAEQRRLSDTSRTVAERAVDVVRRLYRHLEQGDFASTGAMLGPDAEFHWIEGLSEGPSRGRSEVAQFMREVFLAPWARITERAEEIVELGDQIAVRVHQYGQPRHARGTIERVYWAVWTVRNGKINRFQAFEHREEALAAARPGKEFEADSAADDGS